MSRIFWDTMLFVYLLEGASAFLRRKCIETLETLL